MNPVKSLDQQYLDFTATTAPVFAQYPQLEALRYFIFKELIIKRNSIGRKERVKHWLRPLFRKCHTRVPPHQADVLIWIEGCRDVIVDQLLPVYFELESRGVTVTLVSCRGPEMLPPSTLHFRAPARLTPPPWANSAWKALSTCVEKLRHKGLARSFYYASADARSLSEEFDKILDVIRPKIVLTASTQMPGGASLTVAAHSRGATTLVLQHGILHELYTPVSADYMLTWGKSSTETLLKLGVPRQKLIAIGSPRHDAMRPLVNDRVRNTFFRSLSLPSKPTLVFFSNGNDLARNGRAPLECARWLDEAAAKYSNNANIVVRLHPNEDGSLYRNCPHIRITKGTPDLVTTLNGCDWVASLCSTAMYDALLFEKPVWQFYADGWPILADNWTRGLAKRIATAEQLFDALTSGLNNGCRKTLPLIKVARAKDVFVNHGQAADAVARFISTVVESKAQTLEPTASNTDNVHENTPAPNGGTSYRRLCDMP